MAIKLTKEAETSLYKVEVSREEPQKILFFVSNNNIPFWVGTRVDATIPLVPYLNPLLGEVIVPVIPSVPTIQDDVRTFDETFLSALDINSDEDTMTISQEFKQYTYPQDSYPLYKVLKGNSTRILIGRGEVMYSDASLIRCVVQMYMRGTNTRQVLLSRQNLNEFVKTIESGKEIAGTMQLRSRAVQKGTVAKTTAQVNPDDAKQFVMYVAEIPNNNFAVVGLDDDVFMIDTRVPSQFFETVPQVNGPYLKAAYQIALLKTAILLNQEKYQTLQEGMDVIQNLLGELQQYVNSDRDVPQIVKAIMYECDCIQ